MTSVRVTHGIGDLSTDLAAIARGGKPGMARTTKRNVKYGETVAKRLAKANAGPHGKNYYKRITAEMTSPLQGEYGPEGDPKSEFVGVGFRNSAPNMDLPNSADVVGPKFADDLGDMVGGLFRENGF